MGWPVIWARMVAVGDAHERTSYQQAAIIARVRASGW